jgi:hypothetical protein
MIGIVGSQKSSIYLGFWVEKPYHFCLVQGKNPLLCIYTKGSLPQRKIVIAVGRGRG